MSPASSLASSLVSDPPRSEISLTQALSVVSIIVSVAGLCDKREDLKSVFQKSRESSESKPLQERPAQIAQ